MPEKAGSNNRVLVVDDEKEICSLIKRRLKGKGCEIEIAHDAQDAICKLYQFKPAVILLDVRMPGLNGGELLKMIRVFRPEVRVVMMTAWRDQKVKEECLASGADAYFDKPLPFDALYDEIKKAFEGKEKPHAPLSEFEIHGAEIALKVLARKNLITPDELLEEIKRIKARAQ